MNGKRKVSLWTVTALVVVLSLALPWTAFAAVWTDKDDYSPGETVTIFGDNSDGAGYLPDETVGVEVWGPNGYYSSCEVAADENGAWSCEVTLWPDERAYGDYSYTATGQASGVSQSGTFTDGSIKAAARPSGTTFTLAWYKYSGANCTGSVLDSGTMTVPYATTDVIGTGSGQSAKLVAAATSDQGGAYEKWTGPNSETTVVSTLPTICVNNPTGNATYYAHYSSAPANTAPTVTAPADQTANEGASKEFSLGSFTDPDGGPWTVDVDWGDGSAHTTFSMAAAGTITAQYHTYADNGEYTVTVKVTDSTNLADSKTFKITVSNVAPSITSLTVNPSSIDENGSTKLSGAFKDPGILDTPFTVSIDWGEGSPESATYSDCSDADNTTWCFEATHQYLDDNPTGTASDDYTITAKVTDKDGDSGTKDAKVTVKNVAPVVTITSPADGSVFAVNTPVDFVTKFTDPGTQDTWTCELSSEAGTYDPACTSPFTFEDVVFGSAGVYNVTVTVTDDDTGQGSDSILVVVYDPSAGFVTGGGWIYSGVGAYTPDPTLEGRATFGFVSKYLKGANKPTGNTEFQFHAAGFNFKSTDYDWLVVSGGQAQYKGSGTVNGGGSYGFLLTAGDGTPDTFRLKVWDKSNGEEIVYDNGSNQPLGSGSIIIHTGKK